MSSVIWIWCSWDCASLKYSFKYNQQDATLYNILYYWQCCTRFRRFLRPSSGTQKLYTQHRVYVKLGIYPMQHYTIFFITVNAVHVSGGFSAHHQELKNCTHSIGYMPSLAYTRCSVIQYSLLLSMLYTFQAVSPPIIRSSKTVHTASGICQAWHIPDATLYNILYYCKCCTRFRQFLRTSSGAQKLYTQHRV